MGCRHRGRRRDFAFFLSPEALGVRTAEEARGSEFLLRIRGKAISNGRGVSRAVAIVAGRGGDRAAVAEVEWDLEGAVLVLGVVAVGRRSCVAAVEGLKGADEIGILSTLGGRRPRTRDCGGRSSRFLPPLGSLAACAHAVHQVPATPALDSAVPPVSEELVVCAEEVDEVLGAQEHSGLLLALDGVAVLLGRSELPQLRGHRGINIKVRQVT